jgi:hypothetical protein
VVQEDLVVQLLQPCRDCLDDQAGQAYLSDRPGHEDQVAQHCLEALAGQARSSHICQVALVDLAVLASHTCSTLHKYYASPVAAAIVEKVHAFVGLDEAHCMDMADLPFQPAMVM